jgi:hypothetical protein
VNRRRYRPKNASNSFNENDDDENIDLTSSFSNSNSMYWVEKMTFQNDKK